MVRYFTSDQHLGHANIVRYCKRPILRKGDVNEAGEWASPEIALQIASKNDDFIIKHANMRVKAVDTVISVGDFLNYGNVKGVKGLRNKYDDYLKLLNGKYVLIEGNHDDQNGVKTDGRVLFVMIANLRVFVSHYPTDNPRQDPDLMKWVKKNCAFAICGHVHNQWATQWDEHLLNINVGVDSHRYFPISDQEVFNIYEKAIRMKKITNTQNC